MIKYSALVLAGLYVLPSCTPSTQADYRWEAINQTTDTLTIVTHYAVDSSKVRAEAIDSVRRQITPDTIGGTHATDSAEVVYPDSVHVFAARIDLQARTTLVLHDAQWYWIGMPRLGDTPLTHPLLKYDLAKGLITAKIPPGAIQELSSISIQGNGIPISPLFESAWMWQGTKRVMLGNTTEQLEQVFRPQLTGKEHAYHSNFLYRLTVKPGLVVER